MKHFRMELDGPDTLAVGVWLLAFSKGGVTDVLGRADDVEAFWDGCDGVAMRHPYLRMLVEALEERIGGVDGLEVGTAVFA